MTELLTTYTRKDLDAAEPAEEPKHATPAGRRVNVDQADLFNDQCSLFGHVPQPGELK